MQVIIINGMPRAGKDQFVSFCQKHLLWCGNFSTVDFVKEVAAMCGWDGTKTPLNRAFLSNLKDLLTDWGDVPFKKVERAMETFENEAKSCRLYFRFPGKKQYYKYLYCYGWRCHAS